MTPTESVTKWLTDFESALGAGDIAAATGMFDEDCYWRDLVLMTWNIKTMEGRAAIQEMLEARLGDTKPSNWKLEGEATHADGVSEDSYFLNEGATFYEDTNPILEFSVDRVSTLNPSPDSNLRALDSALCASS